MESLLEESKYYFAIKNNENIARLKKDAYRFAFIEENKIECKLLNNGYWEAMSKTGPWVSRKTLAECIDALIRPRNKQGPRG